MVYIEETREAFAEGIREKRGNFERERVTATLQKIRQKLCIKHRYSIIKKKFEESREIAKCRARSLQRTAATELWQDRTEDRNHTIIIPCFGVH